MAEEKTDPKVLLESAREHEERYDWAEAAEDYERILGFMHSRGPGKVGDILERKAFALYKSALQAENIEEFRSTADSASKTYSDAQSFLERADDKESSSRGKRCQAMLALLRFFRSETADERRENAKMSWDLAMEALAGFEQLPSAEEYRKTFNDLAISAVTYSEMVLDHPTRMRVFEEALGAGDKAVEFSRGLVDDREKVRTLVMTSSFLIRAGHHGLTNRHFRECSTKASDYWIEAERLSRRDALAELPFAAFLGDAPFESACGFDGVCSTFLDALDIVRESRDRFMIGHALTGIAFYSDWMATAHHSTTELSPLLKRALDYTVEARLEFSKIGFIGSRGANMWVQWPYAYYHCLLAFWENDPKSKREHSQKALEYSPEGLRLAESSGYTHVIAGSLLDRGNILVILAMTESDTESKRRILEEAVRCLKSSAGILERFDAGSPFNVGLFRADLSRSQGWLAEVAADAKSRIRGLEEAIQSMKAAIDERNLGMKKEQVENDPSIIRLEAINQKELGGLYDSLSELTSDNETIKAAIECFEKAAGMDLELKSPNRAAESLWRVGRFYDRLEDHQKAAEKFLSASENYMAGAEKVPRLKNLYSEYSVYLEAWAEFEKAKHRHVRQEYQRALKHFERAAHLFESLPRWRFLAPSFRAWASLDGGESHSREDRPKEAAVSFIEAADLFKECSVSLEEASTKVQNEDEKKMVARLLGASAGRYRYCRARAEIERAREMDLEGDHSSSCDIYGRSADDLEELAESAPSDQDTKEMRLIATISRAWQRMTQAEVEISPEPYEDAARLFEEAKDLTSDPKTRALTLGHSRFCRALGAGVRFTDSRDEAQHDSAVRHLESASGYYLKAGSDVCSEYARASKLLFDAHALLDEAARQKDQKGAAKAYTLADEVLKASVESFEKAGQKAKTEQVQKLRERVRKEKELAVSLMQVFDAPANMSSTTAFRAITPTQETAAGLDRFLHADIQATVIARPASLNVGEEFKLEIELVNAGNGIAQLTKVEEIIPQGFEVKELPEKFRLEDSYLNLRGRRLDALKTEDIRIVLRPAQKGQFRLRPRIMYLDDAGRYRSHEPEPVEITVRELGISGWLRGADSRR